MSYDILTNIASHHGWMLFNGFVLAILPTILVLLGKYEKDPDAYVDEDGKRHDRSAPRLHLFLKLFSLGFGLLSGYSAYISASSGGDVATTLLLSTNAIMLTSRVASQYKWGIPVATAGGGFVWVQILSFLQASPPVYASVVGWVALSILSYIPVHYAEDAVKLVGTIMNKGWIPIVLGVPAIVQSVLMISSSSLANLIPVIQQAIHTLITEYAGGIVA